MKNCIFFASHAAFSKYLQILDKNFFLKMRKVWKFTKNIRIFFYEKAQILKKLFFNRIQKHFLN